jgi:hypothetical protein
MTISVPAFFPASRSRIACRGSRWTEQILDLDWQLHAPAVHAAVDDQCLALAMVFKTSSANASASAAATPA